jgi:hypothetical protein
MTFDEQALAGDLKPRPTGYRRPLLERDQTSLTLVVPQHCSRDNVPRQMRPIAVISQALVVSGAKREL